MVDRDKGGLSMTAMDTLKPPRGAFPTKRAMVHHALREAILDGRIAPGERVVIDEVARRLKVSIIPVREAIHQLQSERLVDMRPHAGPVVTGFDAEAIAEIFTLLECLEIACARHAIVRADEADLRELEKLVDQMERADGDRWETLNSRFHAAMCAAARATRIAEAFSRVAGDWERLYRTGLRDSPRPDHAAAQADHRALVEALRARDLERMEAVLRAHNRRASSHYRGAR
jgi:DNA-binding GntR family transcriptional regulator